MQSILKDTKVTLLALKNADNEALTSSILDMTGYDSVAFVAFALKGEALDFSIKAQQGDASNMSDAADLAGTAVAFSTTIPADGLTILEVHQPSDQYVRALVAVPNATAATPTGVLAIQFNAKNVPISNAGELHVSPAEGTA
ncbi:MAG: hypothetical protein FD147_2243 [Chloroflexi bacterium]|nr:MAG: hypothetical protein FD147_2243 [Chloroflexota bacterium]